MFVNDGSYDVFRKEVLSIEGSVEKGVMLNRCKWSM